MFKGLRNRVFAALAMAAGLSLAASGCGEEAPGGEDSGLEVEDSAGKEDGIARPLGTFERVGAGVGDIVLLTLKDDRTFHAETQVVCFTTPCYPVSSAGTYRYTRSGSIRYIRFTTESGQSLDRYAYRYDEAQGTLELRAVYTDIWYSYESAQPWCDAVEDCHLQNLITPACVGSFSCRLNRCDFQCDDASYCSSDSDCPQPQCLPGGPCPTFTCQSGSCLPKDEEPRECWGAWLDQNGTCRTPADGVYPSECCAGLCNADSDCAQPQCQPGGPCFTNVCTDGTCQRAQPEPQPADCRQTGCSTGRYCSYCWGNFACIPDGALC